MSARGMVSWKRDQFTRGLKSGESAHRGRKLSTHASVVINQCLSWSKPQNTCSYFSEQASAKTKAEAGHEVAAEQRIVDE